MGFRGVFTNISEQNKAIFLFSNIDSYFMAKFCAKILIFSFPLIPSTKNMVFR